MAKMRKKQKKRRRKTSVSPLTMLRPRLDELLGNESWAKKEAQAIKTDLDDVSKGVKAPDFMPVLLYARSDAPAQVQARLDQVAPEWLEERGYLDLLLALLKQHKIAYEMQQCARAWLEAAGVHPAVLPPAQAQTPFYQAHMHTDGSQGLIIVLWYTDGRRYKVQGLSFLIDFNPPWEGAVKDIIVFPPRSPKRAQREFVDSWEQQQGMPLQALSAAEVKKEILQCLQANQREGIRLPRDLIHARKLFLECVLSLADTPATPPFTAQDFDALCRTGKAPEAIMHFEQTVGRRVRTEDGREIVIMGDPFEDDWL